MSSSSPNNRVPTSKVTSVHKKNNIMYSFKIREHKQRTVLQKPCKRNGLIAQYDLCTRQLYMAVTQMLRKMSSNDLNGSCPWLENQTRLLTARYDLK